MSHTAEQVAEIARGLTKAQRWFVSMLSTSWRHPREVGAGPNHSSNRDRRLVEASTEGHGREYRLTPLGLAVRAHLLSDTPHD
jgi:hypothetical protein